MKDIVVLYHADCADGFGGAWAAWKKLGGAASYIPLRHQMPLPEGLRKKEVYFIDIVPPEREFRRVVRQNRRVVIIDHHETARPLKKLASLARFDNSHSGSVLAWRYFHAKKKVPAILNYIEDRDLWRFKLTHTRELLLPLDEIPKSLPRWDAFIKKFESSRGRKELLARGKILRTFEVRLIHEIARKAVLIKFEKVETLAVNSPVFDSEIASVLYERKPPMAIVWNFRGPHLKVSLRSPSKNVRKMAEKYGGGGHTHASGFLIKNAKKFPWTFIE